MFYYCVILGSYTYFHIFDQTRDRLFHYLSRFPTAPELLKSYLRASSQEPANRAVLVAVFFPPRRGRAPWAAPTDTGRELEGSGRIGAPMGSALPAAPCPAAPQIRGMLRRPISLPHRAFLSSTSFPRSPLVCASPASRQALMPGVSHFHYLR